MKFWSRFYELCIKNNKKPNNVCNTLGFSTATATHWKNGTVPKADVLIIIADYFDCSVDYLLGRTDIQCWEIDESGLDWKLLYTKEKVDQYPISCMIQLNDGKIVTGSNLVKIYQ